MSHPARVELPIHGMTCGSCAVRLEKVLGKVDGVEQASVNYATGRAALDLRPGSVGRDALVAAVERAGFSVPAALADTEEPADRARARADLDRAERRSLLRDLLLAGVLTVPVVIFGMAFMHWVPGAWASALLSLVVLVWPGRRFFLDGWKAVGQGSANMNTLVSLGAGAAWLLSAAALVWPSLSPTHALYFESAASVVTLVLLGRALEAGAKGKAGEAIQALLALAPPTAHVRRGGAVVEVPARSLLPGDLLILRPGDKVAADGRVEEGRGALDEAMLTGESVPVEKGPGDSVFAGTVNGQGSLQVRLTAVGADTALHHILRTVEEAQAVKPPVQRLVDRISAVFTPVVMVLSLVTFGLWMAFGPGFADAALAAVTVLVIACPCALGLATPTAILVGTGAAAQRGILFRDSAALERVRDTRTVVFDKTGTLSEGRLQVVAVEPAKRDDTKRDEQSFLAALAAIEARSEHPLGQAVVRAAAGLTLPSASAVESRPGHGIEGQVEGARWQIGSRRHLAPVQIPDELGRDHEDAGATVIFATCDGEYAGLLALRDPLRAEAHGVVAALKARGIRPVLLTGDSQRVGAAVARALGIADFEAEVLPADKARRVQELSREGGVAMVGDGVNDAPALAAADVGFAMGGATAVAIEAAPVTLVRPDLRLVLDAIDISTATLRTIRENLGWAFGYNLLAIPVAAGVLYPHFGLRLTPMMAGAAMALSSLSVVLNSLRLRGAAASAP